MGLFRREPFRLLGDGQVGNNLRPDERELLHHLLPQLRELLMSPSDPALKRLFPRAHPGDAALEAEYSAMANGPLLEARFAALDRIEATVDEDNFSRHDLEAWLTGLSALRLVLGTRLDVSEDGTDVDAHDPSASAYAVFDWLGYLVHAAVGALIPGLPPPDPDA